MRILSKKDIESNINTENSIDVDILKRLYNGNAQFIFELVNTIRLFRSYNLRTSYNIASLAIYLTNFFFTKCCYLNYDRFIICCASLLLAIKLRDSDPKIKQICFAYHKAMTKNYPNYKEPLNDILLKKLRDKICIAESKLMRVIDYDFEISLPFDYLDTLVKKFCDKENVFYITKVIIFDAFRTSAPLIFHPHIIAISSFITAINYIKEPLW